MDFRILVPRNVTFGACPKCKEEMTLDRVKAKGKFEKFYLSLFRLKKYHCRVCKWYGTLFIYTFTRNIKRILLNYLILITTVSIICVLLSIIVKKVLIP
jgi:hypothetical protein